MKKLFLFTSSLILATSINICLAAPTTNNSKSTQTMASSSASKQQLATQVWQTLHFDKMQQKIIQQMNLVTQQELTSKYPNLPAKLAKQMAALNSQQISQIFDSPKFKQVVINAYATTFTTAELQALLKFNSSPIGQSIMEKLPQVNAIVGKAVFNQFMQVMPVLMKKQTELLQKSGYLKQQQQKSNDNQANNQAS